MNIKDIIRWAIQRWWWFAISIALCVTIGVVYYVRKAPVFAVEATLMLRQTDQASSNQDEMMKMMGFGGNKIAGDEIKILTSRDLLGQVVDQLGLQTTYQIKEDEAYWQTQYPNHDLTVQLSQPNLQRVTVAVKQQKNTYKVHVKVGMFNSQRLTVTSLDAPLQTIAGEMRLSLVPSSARQQWKATILPRIVAVDLLTKQITVSRLSRESNVITLTTQTACPDRAIATINTLLDLYNMESATDKNSLAVQTEQFLAERIMVVTEQLNRVEAELESYKRSHHIADLDKTATNYLESGDRYEQQVAEVDAEQAVLDYVMEQISKPENAYAMIVGNQGISDGVLQTLILDYNQHVVRRNTLLQTATETNPIVERETELLNQKRSSIAVGIEQLHQTLALRRQHVLEQQNTYDSRLESIPEQERRYLEMKREKTTKENQYLYLIEKREENALLLASDAVPAKIVERAQLNPNVMAPKLRTVGMMAIFFGLLLPLLVYFFGWFRKQYL